MMMTVTRQEERREESREGTRKCPLDDDNSCCYSVSLEIMFPCFLSWNVREETNSYDQLWLPFCLPIVHLSDWPEVACVFLLCTQLGDPLSITDLSRILYVSYLYLFERFLLIVSLFGTQRTGSPADTLFLFELVTLYSLFNIFPLSHKCHAQICTFSVTFDRRSP